MFQQFIKKIFGRVVCRHLACTIIPTWRILWYQFKAALANRVDNIALKLVSRCAFCGGRIILYESYYDAVSSACQCCGQGMCDHCAEEEQSLEPFYDLRLCPECMEHCKEAQIRKQTAAPSDWRDEVGSQQGAQNALH